MEEVEIIDVLGSDGSKDMITVIQRFRTVETHDGNIGRVPVGAKVAHLSNGARVNVKEDGTFLFVNPRGSDVVYSRLNQ